MTFFCLSLPFPPRPLCFHLLFFFCSRYQMLQVKCIWIFITITLASVFKINLALLELCLQLMVLSFSILFLEFSFSRFLPNPTSAIIHVNLYFSILFVQWLISTLPFIPRILTSAESGSNSQISHSTLLLFKLITGVLSSIRYPLIVFHCGFYLSSHPP